MGREDFTKIPNGGPGIEHRMSLIYSGGVAQGRFSVNRFVELVATTPAKPSGTVAAASAASPSVRTRGRASVGAKAFATCCRVPATSIQWLFSSVIRSPAPATQACTFSICELVGPKRFRTSSGDKKCR